MFSKASEYGIRATIFIARETLLGRRPSLKNIAKAVNSPVAFTAKILQSLAKREIINSEMGPNGGYDIQKETLREITLFTIVEAIDGDYIFEGCGLGIEECDDDKPCPIHWEYKKIRENLKTMLMSTTIQSLAISLEMGQTFLV